MSRESLTWLNTNTLIGFTAKRGHAWHWRAEEQGDASNHYPGAIPMADVQDRLFHWEAESRRLAVEVQRRCLSDDPPHRRRHASLLDCRGGQAGHLPLRRHRRHCDGHLRPRLHPPPVPRLAADHRRRPADDDLAISSAGLLREGAIAWVEVSMPETITTPEGVAFRPNLLATTSFDGSIATTYKRTVTDTVCDNTRELALSESGQEFKIKHSRNSRLQLAPARQALADGPHPRRRVRRRGRPALQRSTSRPGSGIGSWRCRCL